MKILRHKKKRETYNRFKHYKTVLFGKKYNEGMNGKTILLYKLFNE